MRCVKPLLLSLLTCSLLSCNPVTTRIGGEKTSDCGDIPIGVTIDKRELDIAGATMLDFSLGKLVVKDTQQFQKIISEAASNSAATDILVCKTIDRAGVRGNAAMVDYFTRMTHFFAEHPSISQQLEWQQKFPLPKDAPQGQSNLTNKGTAGSGQPPEESPSTRLAKSCKQPLIGLRRPPAAFLGIWLSVLNELKTQRFPPDHDLVNLYKFKSRRRDNANQPDDFFRESLYTLKCLEDEKPMGAG